MFIENRIRKETKQIVVKQLTEKVNFEKNLLEKFKRFFRTKEVGTISSVSSRDTWGGQKNKRELKGLFNLQPKTIICEAQAKKLNSKVSFKRMEKTSENGCSSEKEHKVNALALRAEEGRDYLR